VTVSATRALKKVHVNSTVQVETLFHASDLCSPGSVTKNPGWRVARRRQNLQKLISAEQILWYLSEFPEAPPGAYDGDPEKDAPRSRAPTEKALPEMQNWGREQYLKDVIYPVDNNMGDISCLHFLAEYWYSSLLLPSKRRPWSTIWLGGDTTFQGCCATPSRDEDEVLLQIGVSSSRLKSFKIQCISLLRLGP